MTPAGPCLSLRRALPADLPRIVRLFASPDGNARDQDPAREVEPGYLDALAAVDADPNQTLLVADDAGLVVGVLQLTVIQYVAYRGGRVALIETVFVDPERRGRGVGEAMMRWAIAEGGRRGCFRVQLTSNKARPRAHAFYLKLGFAASHEGFKLALG